MTIPVDGRAERLSLSACEAARPLPAPAAAEWRGRLVVALAVWWVLWLWVARGACAPAPETVPNPGDLAVVRELSASYERSQSRIMARIVAQPTRAHLDFATHDRNVLMNVPEPPTLKAPTPRPRLADLSFEGSVAAGSPRDRLADTPLTAAEKREPLAAAPLLNYLANWDYDASEKLFLCAAYVSEEKWGNADAPRPLQTLATLFLHQRGEVVELWAKIEFEPNVTFVDGVTDEDDDGYPEAYGQLRQDAVNDKLVKQLRSDYLKRVLDPKEVETYFYELSSAWYEKLRTVALKPNEMRPWPSADTEPEIKREMTGRTLQRPTAVIRGTPFGKELYNVFLVCWGEPAAGADAGPRKSRRCRGSGADGIILAPDGSFSQVLAAVHTEVDSNAANLARWRQELQDWGNGSWGDWVNRLAPFRADVREQLDARPAEAKAIVGGDGFLFFRGSLEYLLSGDLRQQKDERDPYPALVDYNEQLRAKGIDMLLVLIPAKPEVYPDRLSAAAPKAGRPYVTPFTRKLLLELGEAGVESVDLLPAFLDARDAGDEPFYMPLDTHWSNTALRLAAKLIGARVKQYPWYAKVCPKPVAYTTQEATSSRTGDLRGMLTDSEKLRHRPMKLSAQQVLRPDGKPYEDDPDSPIVMLGDSFCGVFQFEDCQHAGVSAHLAKELGRPVDLIMAHGSGPLIRGQLARRGAEAVAKKKLVIWTVVSRDLYNYRAPWRKIPVP